VNDGLWCNVSPMSTSLSSALLCASILNANALQRGLARPALAVWHEPLQIRGASAPASRRSMAVGGNYRVAGAGLRVAAALNRPHRVGNMSRRVRGLAWHSQAPWLESPEMPLSSPSETPSPNLQDERSRPDVDAEWERSMDALQDLITKRHRERLQTDSLDAMRDYLARLDLEVGKLRVIHVAGTKGKGSTCTMVESILRAQGYRTALYTSPHLVDVRERIRIDGKLLPKHVFAHYFWEVHQQLRQTADAPSTNFPALPGYFRFLTLLAFKVFLSQQVDVAIIEVGLGGRLDATNVVSPVVCGITSLDYDHTNVLGETLPEIAFEKAGILKRGVDSFTAPQQPDARAVLERRAQEVGSRLREVPPLSAFRLESASPVELGLQGEVQHVNAALAVALVNSFLASSAERVRNEAGAAPAAPAGAPSAAAAALFYLPDAYRSGLQKAQLWGRCQRFAWLPPRRRAAEAAPPGLLAARGDAPTPPTPDACPSPAAKATRNREAERRGEEEERSGAVTFYIDGAHTKDSLAAGVRWAEALLGKGARDGSCGEDPADGSSADGSSADGVSRCGRRRVLVFYCSGALASPPPPTLLPSSPPSSPREGGGLGAGGGRAHLASEYASLSGEYI
jgi:folylpolyglutamate synthase/dihydrofolate synthase